MPLVFAGITLAASGSGALSVVAGLLTLSGGWPVVDDHVYRDAPAQVVTEGDGAWVATYDLGANVGRFVLRASTGNPDRVTLQYALRNVPAGRTFSSFGVKFDAVSGMKRYYRSGYHSWDGSSYVQPEGLLSFTAPELTLERSYGVTELVPADGQAALVMGFDRHDRYQQTFTFGARRSPPDLALVTWWDQKPIDAGGAPSETLLLLQDPNYEEGLRRWARLAAAASPLAPRTQTSPLIGWDSWYNLYNFIDEPLIRDSLAAVSAVAQRENLPMKTFLIDAGFTPELGDWLKTSWAFPNGMAPLLNDIRAAGFVPGLWIAPHLVGNRSDLFRNHPDWVLKDAATGKPKLWATFYGEQRLGNMRSEEYYVLDTTVPEAFDYLRTVFRTWRRDWGAQMFKVDFTYVGAQWGPAEVQYRNPGLTRIEVWRRFAEMVRQEIGDDGIWVGSGQPLWASIGLADTIRISGDVGTSWSGSAASAEGMLRDLPARNFANHILWQVDPDAVLLRTRFHNLSDTEVRSLALFAGMSGGAMITSDNLAELPPERIRLWRMLLSTDNQTCSYPRTGRDEIVYFPYQPDGGPAVPIAFSDPVTVQVRSVRDGGWMLHILNTSNNSVSRSFALADLGIEGQLYVWDWLQMSSSTAPLTQLQVTLDAHGSALLYLTPGPLSSGPIDLAGDAKEAEAF